MAVLESGPRGGGRGGSASHSRAWLWLTVPITVLVVAAAGGELLFDVFRGDSPYLIAQAVGQDLVTLLVALPALVVGAALAYRGSDRARLVWLGVLVYLVYTYVIYAFHIRFNPLFLVYVALLGFSLYALIGGLATTDFEGIKARYARERPAKAAGTFLLAVSVLFYFVWLGEVIPALFSGNVPQSIADNGTPTNGVHVLDMAWILPSLAITGVWLRRKRAVAYALAGALLTFLPLLALAIVVMVFAMALYGQAASVAPAAIFGLLAVASSWMLVRYMRGMKAG
ncbi:hypothetical protein GBA63_20125 [Rubrobacter tropicus]|uniref:Uncharacterized protein n=1 Tax=Rubrobacter tropicus TaxID=2653851 RepID=A0A6G8QDZ5_9ACTN|nr:hypothetical protein [Rubrobacter tropicus]QIN84699.1 hypothetical protein GBA63_20125 [Rubrobacter tropicus]